MIEFVSRLRRGGRNYAAAAMLNLALVSTVLTAPERPVSAQTRIVTDARRFRDTEVIALEDGAVGVLSAPYEPDKTDTLIGAN
jgi:hypothetical protein